MEINEFINKIINYEEKEIKKIEEYFTGTIKNLYRDYMFRHCGYLYEEDILMECIEKIILSAGSFRGSNLNEFKSYNKRIIERTVFSYVRNVIKADKFKFAKPKGEGEIENILNNCSTCYCMEDEVINRMHFEYMMNKIKFSTKEKELLEKMRKYGSIRDCCSDDMSDYAAAKQMFYRIKLKVRKKMRKMKEWEL